MSGNDAISYQLFAIRYATNPRRKRHENFIAPVDLHDGPMPMDFFVWVAVGGGRTILIDSGADAQTCSQRGHDFIWCPTEGLAAIGIRAEDVDTIVSTHLHWDHAGNFGKFPNARFHAQSFEVQHAVGPCMCHDYLRRPYDVDQVCSFIRLIYGGRVKFHETEDEIAPGIVIRRVGGHAPGLQIVRVRTDRGWVVLASDAMHFYENELQQLPFPVLVDTREYLEALKLLPGLAESRDHIIPGHDPSVMRLYPAHSSKLTGLVARLDVMPDPPTRR